MPVPKIVILEPLAANISTSQGLRIAVGTNLLGIRDLSQPVSSNASDLITPLTPLTSRSM